MLLSRLPDGRPEIFTSIQGEGITCGLASIFVRLSLCNLACSFCDTKYTWDWDRYDRDIETIELAAEDVARDVLARARRGPKNVVITGGEPLLQQRDLVDVVQRLHGEGLGIEVETNGTITPADALAACVDQWNVSPKLASSGNAAAARERAETIAWFAGRRRGGGLRRALRDRARADHSHARRRRAAGPRRAVTLAEREMPTDGSALGDASPRAFVGRRAGSLIRTATAELLVANVVEDRAPRRRCRCGPTGGRGHQQHDGEAVGAAHTGEREGQIVTDEGDAGDDQQRASDVGAMLAQTHRAKEAEHAPASHETGVRSKDARLFPMVLFASGMPQATRRT